MAKILVVEDEQILRDGLSILLRANSYDVDEAENGQVALGLYNQNSYDLILLDLMMPVLDGVGFLEGAKPAVNSPQTKVIVLSNLSPSDMPAALQNLGVHRQEIKANLSTKEIIEMIRTELGEAA